MDDECRTKLTHAASWNESVYKDDVDYFLCSACKIIINDEFYLRVGSKIYHESCLQCAICHIALDEKSTCFLRGVHILCQQDYYKYIINKCSKCNRFIYPHDWVRRACEHTYHLTCFACYKCGRQLSTGEEYAWENNSILCKIHVIEGSKEKYDANKQSETKRIRTAFSLEQLKILQDNFKVDPNPDGQDLRWIAQFTGLITKWLLIQPIHNELAYKYRTNQSLYFVPYSFLSSEHYLYLSFLDGYDGMPMLVDFLSHVDRKFAAFVFAVCADELLNIMQSTVYGSAKEVLTLSFATIYDWLDYSISIITQGMCEPDFYPTDDHRFPTRVISVYTSVSLLLYQVVIQLCAKVFPQLTAIEDSFQLLADLFSSMFFPQPENNDGESVSPSTSNFPVPHLIGPYTAPVFLTLTLIVIQSLILLANVRRNSIQSYRGDDTEIPRRHRSEYVSYAVRNFHFAAHFIGYFIWGFILIAVFSLIICIALDGFITYESVPLVDKTLKLTMPSLLFIFFKKKTIDLPTNEKYQIKPNSQSRYTRKWKLAVFLIRNPILFFFRKAYLNQLNMNEIRYINDDDQDSSKRRLSVYTRRMPIALSSIVSDDYMKSFEMYRF
ncbi:unnamed protein product [Rotaria socialis]|uniref:LIM zinc-binding domain-containing protein n=1 Tax=Rotaria socialis TaxID=392032 RepID=A0A820Y7K0_9BILA|nr:unnamed protein product [Rotaria socialis]